MSGSLALVLLALAVPPTATHAADEAAPQEAQPATAPGASGHEGSAPPDTASAGASTTGPVGRKADETWLDIGHEFIEQRVFVPFLAFDRFFSDERDLEAERARSFLRWRNEVRFAQDASGAAFTTGVRANLRLPGVSKQLRRLRLVIAGETRDAVSALFPREPGSADDVETLGNGDAGLRYDIWESLRTHADVGAGVLVRLPPGYFGRLRLRWAVPIRDRLLARTAVTGFWRTDTRFGTSTAAELERSLTTKLAARLGGDATLSEVSRGVEWGSELALLAYLGKRSGAQIGAAMTGATDIPPIVERYRVYARFRHDAFRRWLFLEVEPGVSWPWTIERGRYRAWGVALRLEVQFHGNEAPPPPAPPPPPEPRDPPADDALPGGSGAR